MDEAEIIYGNCFQLIFNSEPLKNKLKSDKIEFINKFKVAFVDSIESVEVDEVQETNYDDSYIDSRVKEWTNILFVLSNLKNIKRVCFTRKTLSDIPNMKQRIIEIENYCKSKNVPFGYLVTPARFYSTEKQEVWNSFFQQQ